MTNDVKHGKHAQPWRKTLRLTFRSDAGKIELVSKESVDMICPPYTGEPPAIGKHSGFWLELHDKKGKPIFYKRLHSPYGDSVEVHSPDGKIERVVGEPVRTIFQVFLPDDETGSEVVLVGETPQHKKEKGAKSQGSHEIARFSLKN